MSLNYLCPHCKGHLSIDDCVLLSVQTPDFHKGLISLHSELGNYAIKKNSDFIYSEGDELDFFCPICHVELASDVHKKLAKIIMVDENKNEYEVLFSRIAGEQSTFKIVGETMEIYGDDSAEYVDFINLSMNF